MIHNAGFCLLEAVLKPLSWHDCYKSVQNAQLLPCVSCAFSPIYALSRTHLMNFKTASYTVRVQTVFLVV
jgi:hypothetical protein